MKFRKIDTIIIIVLIVISTLFLYKADYVSSFLPSDNQTSPYTDDNTIIALPRWNSNSAKLFYSCVSTDVSAEDEGVHFNELRTSRECGILTLFLTTV